MPHFYLDLQELANRWIQERQLKPNTIRSYQIEVRRFVDWAVVEKKFKAFSELEELNLSEFLGWVVQIRANKAKVVSEFAANVASLEQTRRIARAFLQWLAIEKRLAPGPSWSGENVVLPIVSRRTSSKSEPDRQAGYLPKEVCEILLLKQVPISFEETRDSLMANIAFWCCATTSELAALRVHHVVSVKSGMKLDFVGENARRVGIPKHLFAHARNYLSRRKKQIRSSEDRDCYLFVANGSSEALQPWTIRRRVTTVCAADASYGSTPQKLRRAFLQMCEPLPICGMETAYRSGNQVIRHHAGTWDITPHDLEGVVLALRTHHKSASSRLG